MKIDTDDYLLHDLSSARRPPIFCFSHQREIHASYLWAFVIQYDLINSCRDDREDMLEGRDHIKAA